MELKQDNQFRYYNGDLYKTEQPYHWVSDRRESRVCIWYIVVVGNDDFPCAEEIDVLARDRTEARETALAAIERDYTNGLTVKEIDLA
jgi:hypothetical protein